MTDASLFFDHLEFFWKKGQKQGFEGLEELWMSRRKFREIDNPMPEVQATFS